MDGMTHFENRTAQINRRHFENVTPRSRPLSEAYTSSFPRHRHHRPQSTNDDTFTHQAYLYGHTTSAIGPSASIPERLAHTNGSEKMSFVKYEETDGASMSRRYDVSTADSERKKSMPQHRNVELLNYTSFGTASHGVGAEGSEEMREGETDMTLSQQEFVSDIDTKIMVMMQAKKTSVSRSRAPKTATPLTKEAMREVMNMTPERKKKTSRSEAKRLARNSVHGVPWTTKVEESKRDRDVQLQNIFDKKPPKITKSESAVQLVGYHKRDFDISPSIPEEGGSPEKIRQSSTQSLGSRPTSSHQNAKAFPTKGTISTSESFEFRSKYSPSLSPTHQRSLSPTQELVNQLNTEPERASGSNSVRKGDSGTVGPTAESRATTSLNLTVKQTQSRTVYRPNLEDTHLSDVAVFGKHFDPSQLTQERMEANVGDLSSVGLNLNTSPLKRKEERGRNREEKERQDKLLPTSLGVRQEQRSKSASVSPKRSKGDKDSLSRRSRVSSLKSHESSDTEKNKLPNWEGELSTKASIHSSVISTPSRYRMHKVSRVFRNSVEGESGDVFEDELTTQGSMPELFRRSRSSRSPVSSEREVPREVKEGTPESGTSDEGKPKKKRSIGHALGQKITNSMKLLGKSKKNPTSRTTWHFESGDMSHLYPAPSEPQLSVLTEEERRELLEETEMLPRTHSTEAISFLPRQPQLTTAANKPLYGGNPLGHLFVPPSSGLSSSASNPDHLGLASGTKQGQGAPTGFFEERSVDLPSSNQQRKSNGSDSEYDTASDNEESYVKSAVNIITPPTSSDSALKEAGYFTSSNDREGDREKESALPTTPRTGLPTIVERSPPLRQSSHSGSFQMPPSEGDPIIKSLDGVIDKGDKSRKDKSDGKKVKKSKEKTDVDSKKEKKSLFGRTSKQLPVAQRKTPSPTPISPSSGSLSSGSRQSSGRLSPSRKPSPASGGLKVQSATVEATSHVSRNSLGSSSPRGSIRGGRISPSSRGSPRDDDNSPTPRFSSPRGSGRGTSIPTTPSGLNSARGPFQRGVSSPTPGGLNSPRGSFRRESGSPAGRGSPRGSMRKQLTPSPKLGGRKSPTARSPSPRSSVQLHVAPLAPASNGRRSPTVKAGASQLASHTRSPKLSKRRSSEPVSPAGSPLAAPKRSPSERRANPPYVGSGKPKPVRQAPPPPVALPKSGNTGTPPVSRGSSTMSPTSVTSSRSSPRQRRKGMSLSESPLTPKRTSDAQLHVPASIGEEVTVKRTEDEVGKLLTTVGEKLAPLSVSPEDMNPLDMQTEFEIPPPFVEKTSTSTSPPAFSKIPAEVLSLPLESVFEDDGMKVETVVTPEDSPAPARRGLRPKMVISALIGGRKKTVRNTSGATATESKPPSGGGLQQSGRGSFRKPKASVPAVSSSGEGAASALSNKRNSVPTVTVNRVATSKDSSLKPNLPPTGLPPRGPSLRKVKSDAPSGRSQSTVEVPSIRVTEARKSIRRGSAVPTSSLSTGLKLPKGGLGSPNQLARSSIRVSGKLKKNNPMSPEHRKVSSLPRPKPGDRPPSRGSISSLPRNTTVARSSVRRPSRVAPVAPGRVPMRKVSSGGEVLHPQRKRSNSGTLDRRRQSVLSKSMRKTSTALRPQQTSTSEPFNRNTATRSMRMTSSRKVSTLGTLPRPSVVSLLGSPASPGNTQSSLARKSLRKRSSAKDVYDVFDQISADAKGNL